MFTLFTWYHSISNTKYSYSKSQEEEITACQSIFQYIALNYDHTGLTQIHSSWHRHWQRLRNRYNFCWLYSLSIRISSYSPVWWYSSMDNIFFSFCLVQKLWKLDLESWQIRANYMSKEIVMNFNDIKVSMLLLYHFMCMSKKK